MKLRKQIKKLCSKATEHISYGKPVNGPPK
jgi:hypothetical protein